MLTKRDAVLATEGWDLLVFLAHGINIISQSQSWMIKLYFVSSFIPWEIFTPLGFRLYMQNVDLFQLRLTSVSSDRKSNSDLCKLDVYFSLP